MRSTPPTLAVVMSWLTAMTAATAFAQDSLRVQREFVLETPGRGVANAVIELSDGGFAAVGYADAGDDRGTDVLVVRFDAAGDTLWTRRYGAAGEEFGWDIDEANDGTLFIVGFSEAPSEGREDILVLRIDESGETLWERTFGGDGRDRAWSATLASNGDLVIAAESEETDPPPGTRHRDAFVLRLDANGDVRWRRAIEAAGDQRVYHIDRTVDEAFVVTGTTGVDADAERDAYVARIEGDGDVGWTRSFGDAPDDVGHGVLTLPDGDVLVTGYGASRSGGGTDVYWLRLSPDGELRTWKHEGGPRDDRAMMSAARPDGGLVTAGFSWTAAGMDIVIIESDSTGTTERRTELERPGDDRGVMILAARSGGYVLAGTLAGRAGRTGDFTVMWLDSGGE